MAMSSLMILSSYRDETKPNASLLMLLSDAVSQRQCVDVTYKSEREEITRRVVAPYGLVGRQGKWYLVAFCRLRSDYRTFGLDRIRHAAPLTTKFERRTHFDLGAYAREQREHDPVKWRIKVVFKAPMAAVSERIPASLGPLTPLAEGTLLEWPIDDLDYGARHLVTRGIPFRVREPPEFRESLRKLAAEASRSADAA